MKILIAGLLLLAAGCAQPRATGEPCGGDWYQWVEQQVPTGDGRGHGPDTGSREWQSVVEFRLGVRGEAGLPERGTDSWCRYIDLLVQEREQAERPGAANHEW